MRDNRTRPWIGAIAAIAVLLAVACGSDSDVRDIGTRAVVIGIDGADWKLIDALAARGEMPHLSRLRARGAWGPPL